TKPDLTVVHTLPGSARIECAHRVVRMNAQQVGIQSRLAGNLARTVVNHAADAIGPFFHHPIGDLHKKPPTGADPAIGAWVEAATRGGCTSRALEFFLRILAPRGR